MMSATIKQASAGAPAQDGPRAALALASWPRLLRGTEPIGQATGSGLREPPYLVRRCDGQVVQLSQLLYVIASQMDGRELPAIAEGVGAQLNVRITPEQVAYVAEQRLAPLGLVAYRDGSTTTLERRNATLTLRHRAGIVPERAVNALARPLRALFWPPVVIAALAALVACDVWLGTSHRLGSSLRYVIHHPSLGLVLLGFTVLSMAFHEHGHAAACRYGGARPGRIGVGIYLVFPVFYSDVTDSYRLSKAGRLRTDLGGVYFNALFALTAAGAYLATGYELLLVVVVTQQILIFDQFIPWIRLDGYHVVSDLIGVSDLFARIKPVLASLLPGRQPGLPVTELKPWARTAVTAWVLTTVAALIAIVVMIAVNGPSYVGRAWQSLVAQLDLIGLGLRLGNVLEVMSGTIGIVMLLFPFIGIILAYVLLCRLAGASLALRHVRTDLTLASAQRVQAPPARAGETALAANPHAVRIVDGERCHEATASESRTVLAS
jgi:putative peptide zinc metalloprotease protein